MIFLLLALTATFHPAQPTVGDLVTIDFHQPVTLEASPNFEIVSRTPNTIVIRTFEPKPVALSGVAGGTHFRNLMLPVRSVLKPKDSLEPAPLRPPVSVPYPRAPFVAISIAALACALIWTFVVVRARRQLPVLSSQFSVVDPIEHFRSSIARLRADATHPKRWAELSDATRLYLASLSPHLGAELTTSQLLPRVDSQHVATIALILRQGDLEKFSPWGAPPGDFDSAAERALALIPVPRVEEEEAA